MENFIPEIYSDMLLMEREKETVFSKLCKQDYDGEITKLGDRVHFTGISDPTIYTYTKDQTLTEQLLSDYTVEMAIDQMHYFNLVIDDVDRKQGIKELDPTLFVKSRRQMADNMDSKIALLYDQAGTSVTETQLTSVNIISTISSGITQLRKNNIPLSEEINLVVSPEVGEKILLSDILFNTDNKELLEGGGIGKMRKFINCTVYVSNNVYSPSTVDYCMMFTKEAIGLAEQIPGTTVEKLRHTSKMADIIRGMQLFGAKVIKPKELVTLNLTVAAEEVI